MGVQMEWLINDRDWMLELEQDKREIYYDMPSIQNDGRCQPNQQAYGIKDFFYYKSF